MLDEFAEVAGSLTYERDPRIPMPVTCTDPALLGAPGARDRPVRRRGAVAARRRRHQVPGGRPGHRAGHARRARHRRTAGAAATRRRPSLRAVAELHATGVPVDWRCDGRPLAAARACRCRPTHSTGNGSGRADSPRRPRPTAGATGSSGHRCPAAPARSPGPGSWSGRASRTGRAGRTRLSPRSKAGVRRPWRGRSTTPSGPRWPTGWRPWAISTAGSTAWCRLLAFDESRGLTDSVILAQALRDAGITAPLWALTRGAVGTGPADPVRSPRQAQVWGLGRVLALEHATSWGGLVDLPDRLDDQAAARLATILDGTTGEDQVAIRGAATLARRLVPAPRSGPLSRWEPTGTVLITGGTGALGAQVARWLAERGGAAAVADRPPRHGRSRCGRPGRGARDARHDSDRRRLRRRRPGGAGSGARGRARRRAGHRRGPRGRGRRGGAGRRDRARGVHGGVARQGRRRRAPRRAAARRGRVRPVLVDRRDLGQRRPVRVRRGQRLPRRAGRAAPGSWACGHVDRLGPVGRHRHGRGRRGPHLPEPPWSGGVARRGRAHRARERRGQRRHLRDRRGRAMGPVHRRVHLGAPQPAARRPAPAPHARRRARTGVGARRTVAGRAHRALPGGAGGGAAAVGVRRGRHRAGP